VIVCVNQPDAWGVFVSEVIAVAVRGDDGGPGLGLAERMRTMVTWGIGLALAGVLAGYGQSASAGLVAGRSWGKAVEVPGLAALDKGHYVQVESVSCGSAGNCAAGGFYHDRAFHQQGFVALERNGRWGQAIEVPGLGALNQAGNARVYSVSCGSPGNCAAGGNYTDASSEPKQHGFATVEQNGRWTSAVQMPGPKPLAKGQYYAAVASVSCTRAGPCAAAGYFLGGGRIEAGGFVVSEKDGRWTKAIEVPSLGPPAKGNQIFTMSCATPGNCAAGGSYLDSGDIAHAFVVSEKNGHWANPIKVPGLAALADKQDYGQVFSVSCAAPGNCTAGGFYASNAQRGFVTQSR
jgi:hypothetical protein